MILLPKTLLQLYNKIINKKYENNIATEGSQFGELHLSNSSFF